MVVSGLVYSCHVFLKKNTLLSSSNSVDPYYTQYFAASDLGLRCVLTSHLWYARPKRVTRGTVSRGLLLTIRIRSREESFIRCYSS